jgi:hypothetical protein
MREWLGTTRATRVVLAAAVVGVMGMDMRAASPQSPQPPAPGAPAAPTSSKDYVFSTGAGMLFFYVKPDKSVEFEAVVTRLSEALDKTADPVRKQQRGAHGARQASLARSTASAPPKWKPR